MYENLILTLELCGLIAGMAFINTLLGCIQAGFTDNWSWKKFLFGIIRAIAITLCIGCYCMMLSVIPSIFAQAGIEITEDLITLVQVFTALGVAIKKYATDVYDKIVEILEA